MSWQQQLPNHESVHVTTDWKLALRHAYRDPFAVIDALGIDATTLNIDPNPRFSFLVPHEYVQKMRRGDPNDPLLRQVLPLLDENMPTPDYSADPNLEDLFQPQAGLLEKYAHRVLIVATGGCAVNCRYCFRRHFPYQDAVGRQRVADIIETLKTRPDVHEVILSGGDPLILDDSVLHTLVCEIERIDHIQRIRIHTRLPVVIPQRVTKRFVSALAQSRLKPVIVLHINHAQEIDTSLIAHLELLRRSGIQLLNQSVLLKGINDNVAALFDLSNALFQAGILPYYVHLLDKVAGSAHFDVSERIARQLESALRDSLPGYLVPKFVREIPQSSGKTPLQLI
ncbi:MAG: EF-P beta-lysylation protein EpmB [Pseudomonadota bacterium]